VGPWFVGHTDQKLKFPMALAVEYNASRTVLNLQGRVGRI